MAGARWSPRLAGPGPRRRSPLLWPTAALVPAAEVVLGALVVAAVLVGVALLATGGTVGLLSGTSPITRGLRQLALGLGAAAVTYLLGLIFGAVVS